MKPFCTGNEVCHHLGGIVVQCESIAVFFGSKPFDDSVSNPKAKYSFTQDGVQQRYYVCVFLHPLSMSCPCISN